MQKLDASKEQPVVVLADQDSYDAAATACRDASKDDRCVLGAIRVANPTTALVEVDQALKQARSQAATTFSRHNAGVPKAPYGVPWRPLLRDALQRRPSSIAARDAKDKATLSELHARASGVARAIRTAVDGVDKPAVCLFAPKDVTCVAGMLGALLAGYRFADVPAGSAAPEVRRLFGMIQPDVVLAVGSTVSRVPEAFQGKVVRLDAAAVEEGPLVPLDGPGSYTNEERDGAFCVLTSGTTAAAKLVVCPHAALMGCAGYMAQDNIGPGDAVGLFWLAWYMLPPMMEGASVFALPDKAFADPRLLLDFIRDEKLTVLYVTPSILKAVLDVEPDQKRLSEEFKTVRVVYCTGERLPSDLRARALKIGQDGLRVRNCYSTNEGGDTALDLGEGASSLPLLPDVHAEVLDLNNEPTPIGAVGRLHVKGPALFRGYWTQDGIKETPELYRTGDLVRWVGGNRIEFCGREAGSHVKIRGFKVFPDLIEAKVAEHPSVEAAWAGAVGASDAEMRLECAVACKEGLTSSSLRTWLRERLPPHMVPVVVRNMDNSGWRTERAKWLKSGKRPTPKKLAELLASLPELTNGAEELSDEAQRLAQCWCAALKLPPSTDRFSGESNFFDFGGSLAFVGLASSVEAEFGVKVPVGDLVAAPTLSGMVSRILDGESASPTFDPSEAASRHVVAVDDGLDASQRRAAILAKASQRSSGATVLVTGGTGYVGAFLCRALAERDDVSEVIAVVRAADDDKAAQRLRGNCEARLGELGDWYSKIRAVAGKLDAKNFGLATDLVETLDVVVHGAAEVNMVKPPSLLEASNVGGTKLAAELALRAKAPLLFTSTMLPLEGEAPTGYRLSKDAAEKVLEAAARDVGAVCCTLQIGDLGFARRKGATLPEDDALVVLLRACLRLNAAPSDVDWSASVIPVDDFAAKLAAMAFGNLDGAPFDAAPREAKGDLVRWREVLEAWLPPSIERAPFAAWRARGAEAASQGDEYLRKLELLIEGLVDELHAEDARRRRGEGSEGGWGRPDDAWAARFSAALAAATPPLAPAPPLVGVSSSGSLTDLAAAHAVPARGGSSDDGASSPRGSVSDGGDTRPASPTDPTE